MAPREGTRPSKRHRESAANKHHKKRKSSSRPRPKSASEGDSSRSSHGLSADALAELNRHNDRQSTNARPRGSIPRPKPEGKSKPRKEERKSKRPPRDDYDDRLQDDEYRDKEWRRQRKKKQRIVSGAILEEGRSRHLRGGAGSYDSLEREKDEAYAWPPPAKNKRKRIWIYSGIGLVVVILIIVVAVVVSKKNSGDSKSSSSSSTSSSSSGGIGSIDPNSIPAGTPSYLDPFQWADTTDFNCTYTNQTVGDLPLMGLFSAWDDSAAANPNVPALNQDWGSYASRPARGVNIGGWLSLEPFITPSLFAYDLSAGIIDEYTLCAHLNASCASTLEHHYATFVTEQTFADIADAGLDHVRIPFSYWAVQTYPGDPYLFRTSWRYLLRGIEWARKHGLRVNLDLHALPGSQNGWNHSGRQGPINWLNGTDGDLNAQRSLDVHDRLSKFFAQDRYRNVISHYGLANEPRMTFLSASAVTAWTQQAYKLVRSNGVSDAIVVFGDGFMGLGNWQGKLQGLSGLALDVHQYVIFNTNQIVFNHTTKIKYACDGWTQQTEQSMDTATGFGPTLVAEWSQADTDCATHLTNVGWGNRWTGTYSTGNASTDILTPRCPTTDGRCECGDANADASKWSASYKQFLLMFAEAQMVSFEKGWGWFYWVWDTENAPQWSYKKGLAAGVLPAKAYEKSFDCTGDIPSFSDLPEYY
ncbi:glycoside hydrolase [Coniochaeta ligniaria NRRL 30616]|uniref:glucan 1,3-beta-glucosidase n=1 Tax=Coniochaeta ligniaria NRRL 30616 TaxID=1408157 RepID=A0A1J7IBY3_9PEZI|nr:glycoside hydrolase [Coniochaeta ligniaria NRRL 30616]